MLRKLLLTGMVYLLGFAAAFAQTGTITGTVTDAETGEPIVAANIYIPEIQRGAATDIDGDFEIESVPLGTYTLRVTYVGYSTYTESVQVQEGINEIDVAMQVGEIGLDELIVTGYGGIQNKLEITGSISSVSSEEIQDVPAQNVESLLQGRAAGVQITTTSGNPGGAFQVQVRGNGSINASSQPLYIVDGVPISFSGQSGLVSQSPLNSINPKDIESIQVLKDAAAAAIYGAQAANGVVIITTKEGAQSGTQVSFTAKRGISRATERVDYINVDQYLNYMGEAFALNSGVEPVGSAGFEEGGSYVPYREAYLDFFKSFFGSPTGTPDDPLGEGTLANYDWQDFIYDGGVSQEYNLSISGGDDNTRFYVSGRFENVDGHVFNSLYDVLGLRSNLNHEFSDRFSADLKINLSKADQFGICQDGNFINCPPSQAMFENPASFPFFNNGEYSPNTRFGLSNNPGVIRDEVDRNVRTISVINSLNLSYNITDWLTANGLAAIDYRTVRDRRYETPIAAPGDGGSLSKTYREVYNFTTNATLNARQTFNEVHNLSGLVGVEYRRDYRTLFGTTGIGFPGSFFTVLDASSTPDAAFGGNTEFRIGSYFGNVKYNYDDRYYLSLVGRYDGHSRFGADTRFGFFPSVSAAWRIDEEDFFNADFVSNLKLRAGYGELGNAAIGNFSSRGLYSAVGSYRGQTAVAPTQLANVDLTWEEARELNLGLDFGLFNNRVYGSVDAYRRDNENLLLGRELPVESGYGSITENVGSIRNTGIEFILNTVNINSENFYWSTNLNVSLGKQEVLDLGEDDVLNENSLFNEIRVGQPIGIIQVPRWAGVNPADGRPMWYDANGNITYTPSVDDLVNYKDGKAEWNGGLGNTFSYKGLSLDVFFQFSLGKWAFANTDYYFNRTPDFLMQLSKIVLDRWRQPGDVTYYPRAIEGGTDYAETANYRTQLGTHSIYNASYIRLKNVTLSYNLPSTLTEELNLRGIRLFATGLNLHTWTAWPFYDPEVAADPNDIYGNLVAASYPTGMRISGGIEIQF